jgi:hypothetical protein
MRDFVEIDIETAHLKDGAFACWDWQLLNGN